MRTRSSWPREPHPAPGTSRPRTGTPATARWASAQLPVQGGPGSQGDDRHRRGRRTPGRLLARREESSRATPTRVARRATTCGRWTSTSSTVPEDMERVLGCSQRTLDRQRCRSEMLTFWGGLDYVTDCWYLRRGAADYHRLFRWGPGYTTHPSPADGRRRARSRSADASLAGCRATAGGDPALSLLAAASHAGARQGRVLHSRGAFPRPAGRSGTTG